MLNKRDREERARSIRKRMKAYMDKPRNMTPEGIHRDLMAAYMELGNLLHLESLEGGENDAADHSGDTGR